MASVIIPVYNREDTIHRAITSVLDQTYTNFELIVVNDGSTDNTLEVVRSFTDERLKILTQEENRGANAARNLGIKVSSGKYISFLDSDDKFHEDYLKEVIQKLKKQSNRCCGIFTSFIKKSGQKVVGRRQATNREISLKYIEDGNKIGTLSCVTFKSKIFNHIELFDEALPASQDFDMYLRVLDHYTMAGVIKPLVIKYVGYEQISDSLVRKYRAFNKINQKHGEKITEKCLSSQYRTLGRLCADQEDMRSARSTLKKSIMIYPYNIGSWYLYILTLFGSKIFTRGVEFGRMIKTAQYK